MGCWGCAAAEEVTARPGSDGAGLGLVQSQIQEQFRWFLPCSVGAVSLSAGTVLRGRRTRGGTVPALALHWEQFARSPRVRR